MFNDSILKISISEGVLSVFTDLGVDRVTEVSLSKLEKLYKLWRNLATQSNDSLANLLLKDKKYRQEIYKLLSGFGFKLYRDFSIKQIEALLFYYHDGVKFNSSLLWKFYSIYPETLDIPKRNDLDETIMDRMPHLDPLEVANLFLVRNGQVGLADTWPLSKIMRIFMTKAFIEFVNDPGNIEQMKKDQFARQIDENPLDPQELTEWLKGVREGRA